MSVTSRRARSSAVSLAALFVLATASAPAADAASDPLADAISGAPRASTSVVGGYTPDPSQWPWMASIGYRDGSVVHFCGGALVQPTIIVTAAHCMFEEGRPEKAEDLQVTLGKRDLRVAGGEAIPVARINVHPDYDDSRYPWDVAVLELARPSTAPLAQFLDPTVVLPEGERATVMGWGRTGPGKAPLSPTLLAVDVPLWSGQRCAVAYKQRLHVPSAVCAGFMDGRRDSCPGDSGGPFMVRDREGNWKLLGVVSYGPDCGTPRIPGVYTWLNALNIRTFLARYVPGIQTGAPGTVPRASRAPRVRVKLSRSTLPKGGRVVLKLRLSEAARVRIGLFRVDQERLERVSPTLVSSLARGRSRIALTAGVLGGRPAKGRYVLGVMASARGLDSGLQYRALKVR